MAEWSKDTAEHWHQCTRCSDRDEAKADFTVLKAAQTLPPKTSGDSDMLLWLALMLLSCGGAAAGRLCRKEEAE